MFVRNSLAGAVTLAVTGSVLALTTGAAHATYTADPDDTTFTPVAADVIGVGSDTSQHALFRLATSYNATVVTGARLATYAATPVSNPPGTLTLPTTTPNRPNGSGAGKNLLFGASNNVDVDFARASNSVADAGSEAQVSAGLQQFPFALDTLKLAVSGNVPSHAPATITPADMVKIYDGSYKNWSEVPGATAAGVIAPKIPQAGSGTRSFFVARLKAANNNVAVVLAGTVVEVQEHDPATIKDNPDAVAPFSAGRAALAGTALRLEDGFTADRALYNVVRSTSLGDDTITALFGPTGFVCSDVALDEIEAAGFKQLDSVEDGGVCGQATQATTTDFQLNAPVAPIVTTTTVTGSSPSPKALRLVARVAGNPTPTGTVQFIDTASDTTLGTANLIGGVATVNLVNQVPRAYSVQAVYTPTAETAYVASSGVGAAKVKAGSVIAETFAASLARRATSAKGVVTVSYAGTTTRPSGKVTIKEGAKTVGTGILKAGKVTITLLRSKVGAGRSTLKITYPGDANGFGSSRTFTTTFKK